MALGGMDVAVMISMDSSSGKQIRQHVAINRVKRGCESLLLDQHTNKHTPFISVSTKIKSIHIPHNDITFCLLKLKQLNGLSSDWSASVL